MQRLPHVRPFLGHMIHDIPENAIVAHNSSPSSSSSSLDNSTAHSRGGGHAMREMLLWYMCGLKLSSPCTQSASPAKADTWWYRCIGALSTSMPYHFLSSKEYTESVPTRLHFGLHCVPPKTAKP